MANLEQMREGWDRFAESYDDAITPFSTRVAEGALRIAGVATGDKLLDVGAGGGALSIPAARLGADVLAIDFSPAMIDRLKHKADELRLPNLKTRVMDGTALELDDASFDVVCSQWAVMLFPDRHKGLQEMSRVTRSGGRGVLVVFGPPSEVPIFSLIFQALHTAVPRFQPPQNSPLFSLQDPTQVEAEMREAGYTDVQVTSQMHVMEVESSDFLWHTMEHSAPAIAGVFQQFTDAQKSDARIELQQLLQTGYGDAPFQLPVTTHVGVATR